MPEKSALHALANGSIALDGKKVLPARVQLLTAEPDLPARSTPVRFRKSIPTAWLEITLYEGRNRQVRRMTAAVGHPTLRLVRTRIASQTLEGLAPGKWRALSGIESARFYQEIMKDRQSLPGGGGGIAG